MPAQRLIRNLLTAAFAVYTLVFVFGDLYHDPYHILGFVLGFFAVLALYTGLVQSILYCLFIVCPLLFFVDLTRNPYYTQIALLNILVPGLWLVWLIESLQAGELIWVRTDVDLPLLILIGFSFLTWGASAVQHPRLLSAIYSEGSKGAIFLIVNTYLVYAAALKAQDQRLFKRILWVVYFVSFIAAAYGVLQYFGIEAIWPHNLNPYGSRPVSTFGNPNFMSSFLVLVIPVVIADMLFQTTQMPRIVLLVIALTDVAALLATLTRSSWAGAAAGLAILAMAIWPKLDPKRRASLQKWALAAAAGIVLLVVFWPQSQTGYSATVLNRVLEVRKLTQGAYAPASQRFLIWTAAWDMVRDHPLFGKGWGCFELFYPFYQGPLLTEKIFQSFRTHANNAHNELLEYWAQLGLIGVGLMIWLWTIFFRKAASVTERLGEAWRALAWGLIGGAAGMLVDNLLNVSVHFCVPAFLFWWWVGSVFVLDPGALTRQAVSVRSAGRKALVFIASVGLVCLMVRSFCLWRGEVNFFEGFKLSKAGVNLAGAQAALERAYEWHQLEVNNNYELGNVDARLDQKDKALFMYQRALDANAGYDEIYFNRATLQMQMGQLGPAMENYRMCLGINPLSHDSYNALASLYLKDIAKYGDAAERLYLQGVQLFPQDKDLWNNLGYLYTQRQQWDPAFDAYRQALLIDPEFDLARRNLGAILPHAPQHRSDPVLKAVDGLGEVERLMDARRWPEALTKIREVETVLPRSYRAHFFAGNILYSLNRLEEAVSEYEQAVALQPGGEGAWQNLGVTYDRLNQHDNAERAFRKVLEMNPNNPAVKARLGLR